MKLNQLLSSLGLLFILASCYQGEDADLIIHNATIYSCDENFTIYEAMAIKDGKILQMGPEREIMNGYDCGEIIDLQKAPVYPGFHDAHCHFKGYALTLSEVDLNGSKSFDEVLSRVSDFDENNEFSWVKGRGWDQTLWEENEFPKNDSLNILFPDKPVAVRRVDGHAALVNQTALDIAGITPETKIEGGYIEVIDGRCTGLLLDNAYDSVAIHIPDLESEKLLKLMQDAESDLFEVGLTSINDAGIESKDREKYIEWYSNEDLKIKDYCMLFPDDDNLAFAQKEKDYRNNNLHIKSFKVVADGALGSRGACLLQSYSDKEHHHGFLLRDLAEFKEIAEAAKAIDYQVNTHCIGDSANRTILKVYEEVIGGEADHRWKIEHAQVLTEEDLEYFQNYKIIPSIQPTHCTSDMRWAEERLGEERVKLAYAYNQLLEKAGMVVLGTDFPIERISPLETFYAAVSRMDRDGKPEGGFQFENALSREAALRGMTIWAAYSNFENAQKGSLEEGKDADFVILTRDIMIIPFEDILTTFVEKTYLDGQLVYSAD
ncbi:MAG: putative amidohydrolase YtcJ [Arenicella sp.]|jgi:predicted amidohydrolase YtcJ